MRICYLADAASIYTQRWVRYFADRGHEVHLISYRPWGMNDIDNVESYQLKMSPLPINLFFHTVQIRKLIRKMKPDTVHGHYISTYGFLAALAGFSPLILSAWGSDIMVTPNNSTLSKIKVKLALRKAYIVLTTSHYLKDYIHNEFGIPQNSIKEIPYGIDLTMFHKGYEVEAKKLRIELGIADTSFVIFSPRHCKEHYRIENIVRAMPYIVSKNPDVFLILLRGTTYNVSYEEGIEELSRKLGVNKNIRIVKRELRPQEMAVYYNASDALVSIPLSDQFGGSIQEGMACGVVPIVGKLDVYNLYLTDGKNALFTDAEDPQNIAEKLVYVIQHPEIKELYYETNRKIIQEKEDWNRNAPRMEELYFEIKG